MAGVFISYRREDSAGWTGRIYDRANAALVGTTVYLDVDAIGPGADIESAISQILEKVDSVVVIIGNRWLDARDSEGRRLDDPSDYVRREIAAALASGKTVIPVLVDGAQMPHARSLPNDIRGLASINALAVSDTRFDHDVRVLLGVLQGRSRDAEPKGTAVPTFPGHLSTFIGRTQELEELSALVRRRRLVTLTGPGGSGKTRLAIQLSSAQHQYFGEGARLVDLGTIEQPSLVPGTVAAALGLRVGGEQHATDRVIGYLADRHMLVVLDNCEHVLDGARQMTIDLLQRTARSHLLATSRRPLGIDGERSYLVPPLPVPGGDASDRDSVRASEAVQLIIDRARATHPEFHLTASNSAALGQIARRLDGLPLALELASPRLKIMSPSDLLARLDDQFSVLEESVRSSTARQQTLAATVDWSYQLLTPDEQALFNRLSIFFGGCTLDAAEQICATAGIDVHQILDLLSSLVDQSLLIVYDGVAGRRFDFLETIRASAQSRLADSGEQHLMAERHAQFFKQLAEDWYATPWGPDEAAQLDRLEEEWPNMRRALIWYADNGMQDGMAMAGSLDRFFWRRHHVSEGLEWLRRYVALDPTPSLARGRALSALASLAAELHYWDEAIELLREYGSQDELARSLSNAAVTATQAGQWDRARRWQSEALQLYRASDNHLGVSAALGVGSELALTADIDVSESLRLQTEALDQARQAGSSEWIANQIRSLAQKQRYVGDIEGAIRSLTEASEIEAGLGAKFAWVGMTESLAAALALDRGDVDAAAEYLFQYREAMQPLIDEDEDEWDARLKPLLEWARLAVALGRHRLAIGLLSANDVWIQRHGTRMYTPYRTELEQTLSSARSQIDPEEFSAAWTAGQQMSSDAALDLAVVDLYPDGR